MSHWEFLLQRKGDMAWLSLESTAAEILEGQYRVAVRSPEQANAAVSIAINYRPSNDSAHLPNDQRITKRISADGLLIVLPYTNFTPGLWRIECHVTGDVVVSQPNTLPFAGRGSLQTLKLEVLAAGADGLNDFGSDWSDEGHNDGDEVAPDFLRGLELPSRSNDDELAPLESDLNQERLSRELNRALSPEFGSAGQDNRSSLTTNKPPTSPILQIANQQSEALVQSVFAEFSLFEDEEPETVAQVLPPTAATTDESLYAEHTANETPWTAAQALIKIQQSQYILSNDDVFHLRGEVYRTGELQVCLRNPQTLEVVIDTHYPIPSELTVAFVGGFRFAYDVYIPPLEATPVLIGEVTFHSDRPIAEAYKENYVTQAAITVTYPASRLWAAMHQAATLVTPEAAPAKPAPVAPPPEKKIRLPQLPNFFNKKSPASINDDDWDNLNSYQSEIRENTAVNAPSSTIPSDVNIISQAKQQDLPYFFEDSTIPNQEYEQMLDQPMWEPPVETSPTDRFLNKLQNLSTEQTEEDELFGLKAEAIVVEATEAVVDNPELADLDQQLDREIERLVIEEYLWQPPEVVTAEHGTTPRIKGIAMSTSMDVLPVPTMSLPEGELVAGLPMPLTIHVPDFSATLWVKVWVKDNQTRLIVDGPRWLVEFNHERDRAPLEVTTQITLPLGCMEVTFEAITVESTTKRESHRSRLVRAVVPPQFAGFKM
ncbi:MAG: hypothetical protein WCO45_05975 [Pseudanabaena sp. ELA607]